MPTSANILIAAKPGAFGHSEASAFSSAPGKSGEGFDLLMAKAMVPASGQLPSQAAPDLTASSKAQPEINVPDPANFLLVPQTAKSSSPKSSQGTTKTANEKPATSKPESASDTAGQNTIQPENVIMPIQVPVPTPVTWNLNPTMDVPVVAASISVPTATPHEAQATSQSAVTEKAATKTAGKNTDSKATQSQVLPGQISVSTPKSQPVIPAPEGFTPPATTPAAPKAETSADAKTSVAPAAPAAMTVSVTPAAKIVPAAIPSVSPPISFSQSVPTAAVDSTNETKISPVIAPDTQPLTTTNAASTVDGTSAAKQDTAMKSAEKTIKNASLSGKNLPVSAVPVPRENNLPVRADVTAASAAANYSQPITSTSSAATTQSVVAIPTAASAQIQALERTQTLVAIHALRLASSGAESLQVVIRPDTGTQLSLELRQRGDSIEAQATLQQGDFAGLNQRWPELQRHLEQRGIHLAPLADQNSFSTGNSGDFHQQSNYSSAELEPAEAYAPVALAAAGTTTNQSTAARGWETWA